MNVLFFLTPKKDVVFVKDTDTVEMVLNTLRERKFSSIPILNNEGNYLGTVKEGDLLWFLENSRLSAENLKQVNIMDVPRRLTNETVKIDANVEDLLSILINQNFVPVIDDANIFIGIVKRREVISYVYEQLTIGNKNSHFTTVI